MIIYNSRFLTRGETWFDEEPNPAGLDWLLYNQRSRPVSGAKSKYFHSYLVDLSPSPDGLLSAMHKETVHKIRRARDTDKVTCQSCETGDAAALDAFEAMYNRFASVKGLSPMDRCRLNGLATAGILGLSVAKDIQGHALVYHAYCRSSARTSLLFSASRFRELADSAARNAIGRANRYLTWMDMLRAKEQGLEHFDFGGWYPGNTDKSLLQINEFKKGFGGRVVREYECEQILSVRGWVVLTVAAMLNRAKGLPRRDGSAELSANAQPSGLRTADSGVRPIPELTSNAHS